MKFIKTLLKVATSVLLIAIVIHAFNVKGFEKHVAEVSPATLVLAVAIAMAVALVHAARWMIVIGADGNRIGFGVALRIVLIGHFFNQTLPSSVGGDAVRIWCAHRAGLTLGSAANTVILDRLMTLAALLLTIAAGLPWLFDLIGDPAARWALSTVTVAGIASFIALFTFNRYPQFLLRWRLVRAFAKLASLGRSVMFNPRLNLPVLGLSVTGYLVFGVIVFLLSRDMHITVTLAQCVLLVPPVILVTVLPISIAGWGVREGAMVVAFGFVHVPPSGAFAVSVLFGLVLVAASLPGSVLWWVSGHPPKQ